MFYMGGLRRDFSLYGEGKMPFAIVGCKVQNSTWLQINYGEISSEIQEFCSVLIEDVG